MRGWLRLEARRDWRALRQAVKRFLGIDGEEWARAFAFNAVFSLFPAMILLVAFVSSFVDRDQAQAAVISYLERYIPTDEATRGHVFGAFSALLEARQRAGMVALVLLLWSALQCFTTLVRVTNRAWGHAGYSWWRLPLKGLSLLGMAGGAVLLGVAAPTLASVGRKWFFPVSGLAAWMYAVGGIVVPLLVLFSGLSLFYRVAPRRATKLAEVWRAALCATVLFQLTESLFVVYLENFSKLSLVYGAFAGIMGLLLWIYLTGCILIFGACLCATEVEQRAGTESATPLEGHSP